jgi:CRISPR system Cascade subunit CasA
LGDGYHWAPAQAPRPDDADPLWFYAAALARGQGKTEGFHERWVRIPRKAKRWLSDSDRRRSLAEVATERVKRAGEARKTLHRALIVLLDSASPHPDFRGTSDRRWLARYDAEIDSLFFDRLWDDADLDRDEQRRLWDRTLRELAEDRVWGQVQDEVPVADARRERARVRAWMVLRGGLRKALPKAFEEDTAHAGS